MRKQIHNLQSSSGAVKTVKISQHFLKLANTNCLKILTGQYWSSTCIQFSCIILKCTHKLYYGRHIRNHQNFTVNLSAVLGVR